MKSQMIEKGDFIPEEEKGSYSELQVLCSGAGYYVGTLYQERDGNGEIIWEEPGSRDSGYFRTEVQAQAFLETLQNTTEEVAAMVTRQHP